MMHSNGLTKLLEECGELSQIAAKLSAYPDNDHPEGSDLKARLQEEMADVMAAIDFVTAVWDLDSVEIDRRQRDKYRIFFAWHTGNDDLASEIYENLGKRSEAVTNA